MFSRNAIKEHHVHQSPANFSNPAIDMDYKSEIRAWHAIIMGLTGGNRKSYEAVYNEVTWGHVWTARVNVPEDVFNDVKQAIGEIEHIIDAHAGDQTSTEQDKEREVSRLRDEAKTALYAKLN
jgi:hypothetical protein